MYSVVANEIVDGGRPYIDAVERKPPLLFWTYAVIFKVAGEFNWKALHIVALVWTLCAMGGLYVIGRELFDRNTGLVAALFYGVFQPLWMWKTLSFDGEMVMNLPIILGWAIAFRQSSSRLRPELFAAGAFLGAAFLLKQPAAIAAVPLGIYLLLPSYRTSRRLTRTNSIIQATMLTGGFFAVLGVVTIVLWKQGILRDAFYWTIADHDVPHVFWQKGIMMTLAFLGACLPLVIGAIMACRDQSKIWVERTAERTALFGLLAASAIGAAAGARFYPHYYVQLIPPLALLAAPYYARLWSRTMQPPHWLLRPAVTYAWLVLTVVAFSIEDWTALARRRVPSEAGRYLFTRSDPADRIFVWGQSSEIYLDAERRPASRYITTFPLTGSIFGGPLPDVDTRSRILPGSWDNLRQDFAKHPPAYIIDLYSGPGAQYPVQQFPILAKLLAEHYQPVARTADGVIYRRDDYRALAHHGPKSDR
ncbi:MAG TPA: glycosyltransferase family 39 protein [Candidatus Dormibacteraeota bacterium]|nr:glycosyltransferase family 39 protein [Candidatus Dormibacteraeota bacterium]